MAYYLLYGVSKTIYFETAKPLEPIAKSEYQGITLYYTEVASPRLHSKAANQEAALAFYRIVEKLHLHETLIPFQFPTILQGERAVQELLRKYHISMQGKLSYVANHSEYSLRVNLPENIPSTPISIPTSGKAYMQARLLDFQREKQLAYFINEVKQWLNENIFKEFTKKVAFNHHETTSFTAQLLISNQHQNEYQQILHKFEETFPTYRYLSSGPWAIFTFGNFVEL